MTSFTFSVEQVRSAPPEVRRWLEHEIAAAVAGLGRPEHDPAQVRAAGLAACTPDEAVQIFELIKDNFLLAQVYFELAREMPSSRSAPPLHALSIADMLSHTRLADGDRLADCFTAINQVFQQIRGAPDAALFGFDQYGHVYVHETTHHSIRRVWEQLLAAHSAIANEPEPAAFTLPHLGPSEDIAAHMPEYRRPGNPAR